MKYTVNAESTALKGLFDAFNKGIYGNKVPSCVVTIQRDGGLKAKGYFTPWDAWKTVDGKETAAEINITAEELNKPLIDVAATMLHEIVHAYNFGRGVKDCTRGGAWHNKKFAETAKFAGLVVEEHDKVGYITTGFEEGCTALKIATDWANKHTAAGTFEKYRYQPAKAKPNKKRAEVFKYKCPVCDAIVTSKLGNLHIHCKDCGFDFEKIE